MSRQHLYSYNYHAYSANLDVVGQAKRGDRDTCLAQVGGRAESRGLLVKHNHIAVILFKISPVQLKTKAYR